MEGDAAEERACAFRSAFQSLLQLARRLGGGVAVPFLVGCARAGGAWEEYFDMMEDEAGEAGVEVHVYAGQTCGSAACVGRRRRKLSSTTGAETGPALIVLPRATSAGNREVTSRKGNTSPS